MRFAQDEWRRAFVVGRRASRARLIGVCFICALAPLMGCGKKDVAGMKASAGVAGWRRHRRHRGRAQRADGHRDRGGRNDARERVGGSDVEGVE